MNLYGNRLREIEEAEKLRKAKQQSSTRLTQKEKEEKALEMIARAEALTVERKERSGFTKEPVELSRGGQFMQKLQSDAYLGSEMNLEERLNRNRHYRARDLGNNDRERN